MKKILIIFLLIIIFGTGIYLLNSFGIISVRAWGEKAITSTPFLKNYVRTNEAYHLLFTKWKELRDENSRLKIDNEELNQKLEEALARIEEQKGEILRLEEEVVSLGEARTTEEERLNKLIKIYSEMEASEAAEIFSSLDRDLAITLLQNLKEDQAAAILTNLDPEDAAEFSKALR